MEQHYPVHGALASLQGGKVHMLHGCTVYSARL